MIQRFDDFVTGITACYKYIQRIKSMEMTEFGLKGTHVMCLYHLHQNPQGLTSAELSGLCAEDKAATSRTVKELRERGYVHTESGKNYRAPLLLTESGHQVYQKMVPLIMEWVGAGGENLSDEERIYFYRGLAKIAENLKKHMRSEI